MKNADIFGGRRTWVWFIPLSLLIGLLAALLSGSVQLKKNMRAGAPLEAFQAFMGERIPALMKLYRIPGCSVALARSGEIVWTEAYGYADIADGRLLTTDTPMRVQSISKSVVAWGVMKLAENGRIDLDSPVSEYLRSWQFPPSDHPTDQVTIRRLLSHTAGLPLGDVFTIYSPGEAMPSLREKLAQEAVLIRMPGTGFSYSNTGYNLLELLIEEVTGLEFSEYMRSEVLEPLGMKSASFDWTDAMTPPPPAGYDLNGQSVPVYVYPEKASGGLFATAEDIARFAVAGMRSNPVISPENVKLMHTPESRGIGVYGLVFDGYGLGHYIETLPAGLCSVSHGGQGSGIMTHFQAVPETGDAIVILTNSQRSWPFISYLLRDWAQWRGFPSVGMGRIVWGKNALWAIIGLIGSAALLQALRIAGRIMARKPRAALRPKESRLLRCTQLGSAVGMIAILAWCRFQKYLFLSSVFPIASAWLGISTFALAIVLLLSALLPAHGGEDDIGGKARSDGAD